LWFDELWKLALTARSDIPAWSFSQTQNLKSMVPDEPGVKRQKHVMSRQLNGNEKRLISLVTRSKRAALGVLKSTGDGVPVNPKRKEQTLEARVVSDCLRLLSYL